VESVSLPLPPEYYICHMVIVLHPLKILNNSFLIGRRGGGRREEGGVREEGGETEKKKQDGNSE